MISVVIPSRLRSPRLRTLDSLAGQALGADEVEVIVVGDGADPAATALVAETEMPFHLRVVTQPHAGQGAARNRGAVLAAHGSIVFLDDDMTFDDDLLEALQRALDAGRGRRPREHQDR